MGLLNIIRRMALRDKLSIREISRRTGLSRNTITKHLNAGTIEPRFTTPERQSKLDPFADKLAGWLKTEAGKSRKQRRTLKHLHADLVVLGFTGSYGRVAAFARNWRADRQRELQTCAVCRFMEGLENNACLANCLSVFGREGADGVHAPQRQDNRRAAFIGGGAARHAAVAALRDNRHAVTCA